jgi:hypothetical protein
MRVQPGRAVFALAVLAAGCGVSPAEDVSGALGCDAGYTQSGNSCIRTVINCTVANGSGTQTWNGTGYGACVVSACDAGFADCDGAAATGCEIGLQNDVSHCGACGNVCPPIANGTAACTAGACGVAACEAGYTLSSGNCIPITITCSVTNGTGTQTWNGTQYGACNATSCDSGYHLAESACAANVIACTLANATATQTWNGTAYDACTVNSCIVGYANCNAISADGCEVNTLTDSNNCGTCGHACGTGMSCVAGSCTGAG